MTIAYTDTRNAECAVNQFITHVLVFGVKKSGLLYASLVPYLTAHKPIVACACAVNAEVSFCHKYYTLEGICHSSRSIAAQLCY